VARILATRNALGFQEGMVPERLMESVHGGGHQQIVRLLRLCDQASENLGEFLAFGARPAR
jgi:hypothetical protein